MASTDTLKTQDGIEDGATGKVRARSDGAAGALADLRRPVEGPVGLQGVWRSHRAASFAW